jgi:hypothetical protein
MKKIFKELFELFVKSNKREPNAIEMLQLKFKASQKASQQVGKGEVIPFPPERITDWTKARPQPPEIEIIDGVQTTRGLGDLFERQMKNIGKKDPALYEDRGGNIIPAQFDESPAFPSYTAKETEDQIIAKLKNKSLDPDDALPNYTETPGEYSRRNTPGSIENLREEMKIAYRNEFDRLTGNETAEELKEILKNLDTDGVPFAEGGQARSEYSKGLKVKGSGSISGKQDMYSTGEKSAIKLPEGVTSDESFINLIANLDIPISKKISLLGDVQYNKFRNKIQKGDEELFLEDPASSIDRKIGIGFDSGTGTTGSAKYGIDDKGFMFEIKKNFAEGGPTSTGLNYLLGEDDTNSRVSYGAGGRRGFLKLLAGLGAAGAAFKTGLLGLTKGGGKKVATEVAKEAATGGAPPHFFKLVAKIKALGDDVTEVLAYKDRQKVTKYKDFELTEDLTTGRQEIQRYKVLDDERGAADYYGNPLTEETYMGYSPGEEIFQETAKGKTKITKTQPEYEEGTAYIRSDKQFSGDVVDEMSGIADDIYEEAGVPIPEAIRKGKADGGRMGYAGGGMGKRAFLKMLGGVGAGIAGLKTGLLGLTKGGGKKVATEAVKEAATGGPPPHFFKLVAKIKALGDESTAKYATKDREVVTRYKDYTLTEDITTGEKTIQRFKQSEADYYDEPLMEEVYMSHRPGEMTEGAGGKFIKTADEYTEDTSFLRTSRGNRGDVMDTVDGIPDDLLEELGETIVKKADGGRIGYAGGKKVVQGLISLLNKKAGKNVLTTADKLPIPKKTIDRDMFRQANNRLNKKRQLTDQEIQDYEMELGDSETWMSEGTVGEAENALKNQKAYQAEMYQQYKMGKLDPVAGDKSPARKRFLEKKLEEMLLSDDPKLMTKDEIEELTFFDMGTEIDQMRKSKPKSIIPKDEYAEYKKDFDKEILGKTDDIDISQGMIDLDEMNFTKNAQAAKKAIDSTSAEKKGKKLADSMSDAEIDLRDEFPGIEDRLIKQILTDDNPQRVAEVKQTMREALEMQNKGMSVDEIIQTFKGTTRTKQAEGGRMDLWLGGGLKAGKSLTREMLKFMSKGSTNAKSPKELLKLYNPKQFNRLLDNPLNTGKISPETGETADEMILDMINRTKEDRADMVGDLIGSARRIKKVDDEILAYKNKIIKEMVDGGIDEKTASSFADLMAKEMKEGAAPLLTSSPPKITEQGLIELENIQKNLKTKGRKLNATGGLAHLLGE